MQHRIRNRLRGKMSKTKSNSKAKVRATTLVRASFHPQRGGVLTQDKVPPGCLRYRGGSDGDWREIACLDRDELGRILPGQRLPRGFIWADPARQHYGMGGARGRGRHGDEPSRKWWRWESGSMRRCAEVRASR